MDSVGRKLRYLCGYFQLLCITWRQVAISWITQQFDTESYISRFTTTKEN